MAKELDQNRLSRLLGSTFKMIHHDHRLSIDTAVEYIKQFILLEVGRGEGIDGERFNTGLRLILESLNHSAPHPEEPMKEEEILKRLAAEADHRSAADDDRMQSGRRVTCVLCVGCNAHAAHWPPAFCSECWGRISKSLSQASKQSEEMRASTKFSKRSMRRTKL
jgi:hypothetical protein